MKVAFAFTTVLFLASAALAAPVGYDAFLDGPSEASPNNSPGTGYALVLYDPVAHTLEIHANFSGLTGLTTAAHIHCCTAVPGVSTAGVATATPSFPGFPLGVTGGTFDRTFDLTLAGSWNASFINNNGGTTSSAEAVFGNGLASGKAYFNIHSTIYGGGEIRGFLAPVPEPGTWLLAAAALGAFAARRRRAARS